jgi:amidohydrolase
LAKTLGAEDFPSLMQDAPGAMYTLGTKIEGRPLYELHHPKFDLDERALPIGTAVITETALRLLKS